MASIRTAPTSYVALSADPTLRQATLVQLKDFKLDAAVRFLEAKGQHMDMGRPYAHVDRFDYQDDSYFQSFRVDQFANLSLDGAFDAVMEFNTAPRALPDQWRTVQRDSESVDALDTIRQDKAVLSFPCARPGLLTVVEEVNTLIFTRKTKHRAVVVAEKVDDDELQPYAHSGKLRLDMLSGY